MEQMKAKVAWGDIAGILLLTAGMVMLGVSVFLCFSNDIWYDELFTMGLAGRPLGDLVAITAKDVHPPLYYIIARGFLLLGKAINGNADPVIVVKLVSVLPFFLCFLYAVTIIRKEFGMLCAGLFFFLLLSMPQLAGYTVEMRMYGYALFFVTAGMLHAYFLTGDRPEKKIRKLHWAALTFYAAAACYTHYFACVAAVMVYVYLFEEAWAGRRLKQQIKPFLLSGCICGAGYLPWLFTAVVSQVETVKGSYWIMPLTIRTLGGCVKFLFLPSLGNEALNVLAAAGVFFVFAAAFLVFLFRGIKKGVGTDRQQAVFDAGCIGVLLGIVLFGFAASLLIRPIFVYRYMLPAMGCMWLAFAIAISKSKSGKRIVVPILVLLFVIGIRNYRSFYGEEMWKRVQMEQTKEALLQIDPEDSLVFNFDQTQGIVSYYLANDSYLWYGNPEELICQMYPQNKSLVEGEFDDGEGIRRLKELLGENRQVWFLGSGQAREEILEKWQAEGISAEKVSEAMLERYWVNIYKLKM